MAVFDTKYRELEARDTQLRQEDNRLRQEKVCPSLPFTLSLSLCVSLMTLCLLTPE